MALFPQGLGPVMRVVFDDRPADFFLSQELNRGTLPAKAFERFAARYGAGGVIEALEEVESTFSWEGWFGRGYTASRRRSSERKQRVLEAMVNERIGSGHTLAATIAKLLMIALVGQNEKLVKESIIPELRRRGVSRGAAHSLIAPWVNSFPPYDINDSEDEEYIASRFVDFFLKWWDETLVK